MRAWSASKVRFWAMIVLLYAAITALLVLAHAPSPYLFAGVVAGALCAVRLSDPQPLPGRVRQVGLAIIGVGAGARIDLPVLRTIAQQPVSILGAVVASLLLSMLVGQVLRLSGYVDTSTALFASIAGGAAGVAAAARELGADETIVMTIQYLRVLFVLVTVPLVAPLLGGTTGGGAAPLDAGWASLPFTVVALTVGLGLARVLQFSASRLVMPLLVATGLAVAGVLSPAGVPAPILSFGYATTGLMVGLSFTPRALRQVGRLMPLALLQVVLSVATCAAVGGGFALATGLGQLDGYLATTPGGLPAVVAIAVESGAGVGIVITVQLVRIFLALLLAPAVGAAIKRRTVGGEPEDASA
jgi:uncharacterized protein